MDQLNQAHLLLAGPADTAMEFFGRAAQAVAVATGSRWGGVGFSQEGSSELKIVAIWDRDSLSEPFSFNINGSPCEMVYKAPLDDAHVYYPSNVQEQFSDCELLKQLGVESYRGQAFYGEERQVVGHIFSLDEKPQPDRSEIRFFFGLLSQRMSAEFRRFNQQDELRRYSHMVKATRHLMSFVDTDYSYRMVSQGYVDTFNLPRDEIIGLNAETVHGREVFHNTVKRQLDRCFAGKTVNTRHWIYPPGGVGKYLDVWKTPFVEPGGLVSGAIISAHDITQQKETEDKLRKLSLAVTHSPVLTLVTDPDGVIEYISPVVEQITGYRQSEVIGKTPRLFKSGNTDPEVYKVLWRTIKDKQTWSGEMENRRKDGRLYWEQLSIAPVLDDQEEIVAFVGISMDITERKRMEQQLKELASSDPLTGIFNRRHFMEELTHLLDHSKRYGMPVSLMIIDIDNFKNINDKGGHALGDEAIRQFVDVCRKTIRTVDIFARMGGDEFAIAMPETDAKDARVVAERLISLVRMQVIKHQDNQAKMTISIGLCSCIVDENEVINSERFLHLTDKALYQAKEEGRDRIVVG